MDRDFLKLLGGARRKALGRGRTLRLLSAREVLEARREAEELARDGAERALCSNACLLARALERWGRPVYESGREALERLTPGAIENLARQWAAFDREENPSPEDGEGRVEALKKAWSTHPMSALSGACSGVWGRFRPRRQR